MSTISALILFMFVFTTLELIVINLILPLFWPLNDIVIIADIFNKTAIGFGAIIAGLGGFRYLENYFEKERIARKKRFYEKCYPPSEVGKGNKFRFSIIHKANSGNPLYLYDRKKNTMRHIGNNETFVELGWNMIEREDLSEADFNKIEDLKDPILISGKIGK